MNKEKILNFKSPKNEQFPKIIFMILASIWVGGLGWGIQDFIFGFWILNFEIQEDNFEKLFNRGSKLEKISKINFCRNDKCVL